MSSLNHHKVRRYSFIIKGGIEVAKLFFLGNFGQYVKGEGVKT